MKTLQQLLGRNDRFFDLLESSAKEALASVQLLLDLMKNPDVSPPLDEVIRARRKDKQITEQITEELCKTFITPLEREDIEKLSVALYKIPKMVEKFSERFLVCRSQAASHDFSRQLTLLKESTETVATMVNMIRTGAAVINNLQDMETIFKFDRLHRSIRRDAEERAGK